MNAPPSRRKPRKKRSGFSRFLTGLIGWGAALTLLAALGLALAVALSMASLPTMEELKKSPQGQSVVIRAADGTELVTMGPSYGRWLPYSEIPTEMVEAMKAVVLAVCSGHYVTLSCLAQLVNRDSDAFRQQYLKPLAKDGKLRLAFPTAPTHAKQAYRSVD